MQPVINDSWYSGSDLYSDGDIEWWILQQLTNGRTPEDLLLESNQWPVLYHFSSLRKNIVQWIDFPRNANTLEIGGGLGAITGELCRKSQKVTCVDLSMMRSRINAERNKLRGNLEIIVANLNDVPLKQDYDVVTLIGVLEYGGRFSEGENPYADFLRKTFSLVKEGGMLIIAIENRMGLKYFAGADEDHYAEPFVGLNHYRKNEGIQTFDYDEMKQLLGSAGIEQYQFYLPFPDYKFPTRVVSADHPEFFGESLTEEANYGAYKVKTFDQKTVFSTLQKFNMLPQFANSFLIIASKDQTVEGEI